MKTTEQFTNEELGEALREALAHPAGMTTFQFYHLDRWADETRKCFKYDHPLVAVIRRLAAGMKERSKE